MATHSPSKVRKEDAGAQVDDTRYPFIIVDPRAGRGLGIGGFRKDSEVGVIKASAPKDKPADAGRKKLSVK